MSLRRAFVTATCFVDAPVATIGDSRGDPPQVDGRLAAAVRPRETRSMRSGLAVLVLAFSLLPACAAAPPPDEAEPEVSAVLARRPRAVRPKPTNDPEEPRDPLTPPRDVASPPRDATVTDSGVAYRVLAPGKGTKRPGPGDTIEADYTGWSEDGVMFDSSLPRGEPIRFKPEQVIKGWSEVVQLMVEGEKVRVWIPAALAYGDQPRRGTPSGQLTFEIELHRINPAD